MNYTGTPAGGAHTERKENMAANKISKYSEAYGSGNKSGKVKNFFARWSKFTKAALILVLALFVVGACTIGGFNGGGGACFLQADSSVVFYLDYQNSATLEKVYINAGTAYTEIGSTYTITVRTASATWEGDSPWSSSYGFGAKTFSNVYSSSANAVGTNYNWVQVRDESSESTLTSTRRLVQITASCDMLINEVVFVDTNGSVIPAYVDYDTVHAFFNANSSYQWDTFGTAFRTQRGYVGLSDLVDAQYNYTAGDTAYSNFTEDEMYTLMQIENVVELGSRGLSQGSVFNADTDHGTFAVLPYALSTLIFGRSAFGLRIVSVLFMAATVWMIWLLARELFARGDSKKEGWAFLTACLFAGGGTGAHRGPAGAAPAHARLLHRRLLLLHVPLL